MTIAQIAESRSGMVPYVYARDIYSDKRGRWIAMSKVQFDDIEEDDAGFDVIVFYWKGKKYRSPLVLKAK